MWEIIQAAGWPIWPLILTSIIGVAIILERFWSLRKSQIIPEGLMNEINTIIKQSDIDSNKFNHKITFLEEFNLKQTMNNGFGIKMTNNNGSLYNMYVRNGENKIVLKSRHDSYQNGYNY